MSTTVIPIKEVARRLCISVGHARRKVYRGEITSVKINGGKLLVPESEIDRLIREGTRLRRDQETDPAGGGHAA